MKNRIVIILAVVIALLIAFAISIPVVNDLTAKGVQNRLLEIPLPNDTQCVESVCRAGKFTGNGNGMQYFGAMLIKSELTLEQLNDYYENYREDEWKCLIKPQTSSEIRVIDHGTLSFKTDVSENQQYYIVYSWGDGLPIFEQLDIRGH